MSDAKIIIFFEFHRHIPPTGVIFRHEGSRGSALEV